MLLYTYIYRIVRRLRYSTSFFFSRLVVLLKFYGNEVHFSSFHSGGVPFVMVASGGKATIGRDFVMNNGVRNNPVGNAHPCVIYVACHARLTIGNNVGISHTALIAHDNLTIEDNVIIGSGTNIYTSDFHPIDPTLRTSDVIGESTIRRPVFIGRNVFIGAQCIILKGVSIGENSVIGAGSVVTKSIPANQLWAGNPAVFVRNI